ncbi:hypothetical protein J6590_030383 [Homalodisca vitripennis]|nr:hypothetical protein J6590_030383 [Homalodisca vitripennis]
MFHTASKHIYIMEFLEYFGLAVVSYLLSRNVQMKLPVKYLLIQYLSHRNPMVQCRGYGGYRKITESSNVERGCC